MVMEPYRTAGKYFGLDSSCKVAFLTVGSNKMKTTLLQIVLCKILSIPESEPPLKNCIGIY